MTATPQSAAGRAADHRPGVIFDLDGTLADTLLDIAAGVNHALAGENLPAADPEQVKGWVGEGYPTLMRRAAPAADEAQLARLVQNGSAYYALHALDNTYLYAGMAELLAKLEAAGLPLAVLSNKTEPVTVRIVRHLCPAVGFAAVIGYRDEASKKPNPAVALEIAARMALPPREVVFVGDSATDIATGRNARMRVVAVTWGFRSRADLLAARPDHLIDKPCQLPELLGIGA